MSRMQFRFIITLLRHAWLNLKHKHIILAGSTRYNINNVFYTFLLILLILTNEIHISLALLNFNLVIVVYYKYTKKNKINKTQFCLAIGLSYDNDIVKLQ